MKLEVRKYGGNVKLGNWKLEAELPRPPYFPFKLTDLDRELHFPAVFDDLSIERLDRGRIQ